MSANADRPDKVPSADVMGSDQNDNRSLRRRRGNQRGRFRDTKFEGQIEELKKSVCNIGNVTGKDTFTRITHKIMEHVSRTLDDAREFCTALVNTRFEPLNEPDPPADPRDLVELHSCWQTDFSDKSLQSH